MQKLSIIIPAYNEKGTILKILAKVKKAKSLSFTKEIIVVDDYSTDGTRDILRKIGDKSIKIIYHENNKGKGSAVRTGLKQATGDVILIQDADLEYNPNDYEKLLKPIVENKTKVVYGSRFEVITKNLSKMY